MITPTQSHRNQRIMVLVCSLTTEYDLFSDIPKPLSLMFIGTHLSLLDAVARKLKLIFNH